MYRIAFMLALVLVPVIATMAPITSYAEKAVDIYNTRALVINQTPEIRQQAAVNGLKAVLIRLSGSRDVTNAAQVKSALNNATDYLDRFSYQSTQRTLTIAGAQQPATLLLMQFNASAVKQLLKQAGLPIWSERRPDVLVWSAWDARGKKYVDADSKMARALNKAAENRGLPIVLPVLDLEDRSALPVARLWALDDARVSLATKRYSTNAVLSGRFSRQSRKKWSGNFILMHQGKNTYLTVEGDSEFSVASSVIDQVTDYFSKIYAVNFDSSRDPSQPISTVAGQPNAVSSSAVPPLMRDSRALFLQVNNVNNFAQYTVVMNYLETLSLVSKVKIASAKRPHLLLDVQLLVNKDQFLSTLDLDNRLQRVSVSGAVIDAIPGYEKPLEFIWR